LAGDLARTDSASSAASEAEQPLRPEDVERQLRIALRAAERGESGRAIRSLDRILSVDPLNREGLLGRAAIALEQSEQAASPDERATGMDKAAQLTRTLHRAYEKSNAREKEFYTRVLFAEAKMHASQKLYDRALVVLKEAYDWGFDLFDRVEKDESMAALRSTQGYNGLLRQIDEANLAAARGRVKDHLDHPVEMSFDFTLPDLDGKPFALAKFKGKVVIVDIWGTWCKPCREAIPGLCELYRRHRRRGLEIVGIDYEKDAPDAETARPFVKRFVQESGIPYPSVMGDEATLKKIPNFHGFPTTMVIDQAGKVRLLITDNSGGTLGALDDTVQVLLAQPPAPAGTAAAKPK
jgi:thiol-disulfide isomerase/thioredoxin